MKKQVAYSFMVPMVLVTVLSVSVYAAGSGQGDDQRRRKGPPQEAFELCKDKSAGDSVEITSPQGEIVEGVCKEMHGQMVAFPVNMPERGEQKQQ